MRTISPEIVDEAIACIVVAEEGDIYLTKQNQVTSPEGQAGIEITEEMIEAGINAFCEYDPEIGELGQALSAAFLAMIGAGLSGGTSSIPREFRTACSSL